MRRGMWLLAAACALAVASPASAATIDLGVGTAPRTLVDPAGTAHIVFDSGGPVYCRLPRNATACDVRTQLTLDGRYGHAQILRRPTDGALFIVQTTGDQPEDQPVVGVTWVFSSGDGGVTWQGPAPIAYGSSSFSSAVLSPDGQAIFTVASDIADGVWGFFFQRAPLAGGENRTLNLEGGEFHESQGGDLAVLRDGRVLALDATDELGTRWRIFGGGDIYDQNAWRPFPPATLHQGLDRVVTGPRGTYLMEHRSLRDQRLSAAAPFGLRSFDARRTRWRAVKTAGADRTAFGAEAIAQDAGGRLHLAWGTASGTGPTECIVYARTGKSRRSWFGRSTTLFRTPIHERSPRWIDVAAGPGGRGVVVWSDIGSGNDAHTWVTTTAQSKGRYRPIANPFDRAECPRR